MNIKDCKVPLSVFIFFIFINKAVPCPSGCLCSTPDSHIFGPNLFHVSCDRLGWTMVSPGILQKTTSLSLTGNRLQSLEMNTIGRLTALKSLYLGRNLFTSISNETVEVFKNLRALEAIDLSENQWDCTCNQNNRAFVSWMVSVKGPRLPTDPRPWVAFIDAYAAKCYSPQRLAGTRLDKLSLSNLCN